MKILIRRCILGIRSGSALFADAPIKSILGVQL